MYANNVSPVYTYGIHCSEAWYACTVIHTFPVMYNTYVPLQNINNKFEVVAHFKVTLTYMSFLSIPV